jgi:3-oxoacyl-[acyl-carrier protein] reductase
MLNLVGRTAIVTGAARGLGRAYAAKLMEAGMNVVAADKADASETVGMLYGPGRALAVAVDVADFKSVAAMAEKTLAAFGRIDVLVSNAALYGGLKGGRIEEIDEAEWDRSMAVNVKGVWNCARAVIPAMKKQGGGSIINIASLAALYGLPYALHYSTAKAAVIGMTRAMARELGRDWIRVNAIAPSAVLTEGTKEFFGEKHAKGMETIRNNQALKRNLVADDLVGTVLFLAGDGSKFMTGQTLMVDGGSHFL